VHLHLHNPTGLVSCTGIALVVSLKALNLLDLIVSNIIPGQYITDTDLQRQVGPPRNSLKGYETRFIG